MTGIPSSRAADVNVARTLINDVLHFTAAQLREFEARARSEGDDAAAVFWGEAAAAKKSR